MTLVKSWQILMVLFATLGTPIVAGAQTESQKKEAKEHFEKASRLYELQKYGDAIAEYESAYLLVEDPALLFNIGQAYRLWDKPEDAIRSYKNYLRRRPDATNRADVEKKIVDLENQIEEKRIATTPAPIPVLAEPAPTITPPVAPPVTSQMPPTSQPPKLPAPFIAAPPQGATTTNPALILAPAKPPSTAPKRWLPYSLLGIGGVGLFTATVAGMVGAQKANKLSNASKTGAIYDPAVAANGKTANGVAVISALVGLAASGTGVYLYRRMKKQEAAVAANIFPVTSSQFSGGVAQVTF
jgi:tetratricopeptide (TPR) repeat protein